MKTFQNWIQRMTPLAMALVFAFTSHAMSGYWQ